MTCYLLCSAFLFNVERFNTYEEAVARKKFLNIPGYHIYRAKLVE